MDAEDVGDRHDEAAAARRRVLELRHERVVAEPVLEHELRAGHGEAVRRARLEEVRVGVRAREDGGDRDVATPDLRRDVPVDVLGGHDIESPVRRRSAAGRQQEHQRDNENGSHPQLRLGYAT